LAGGAQSKCSSPTRTLDEVTTFWPTSTSLVYDCIQTLVYNRQVSPGVGVTKGSHIGIQARAAEKGAEPTARAEAWLVLVRRRLEHDGARAEGGEIHYARRPAGESLDGVVVVMSSVQMIGVPSFAVGGDGDELVDGVG
jgi:hypothetical protein